MAIRKTLLAAEADVHRKVRQWAGGYGSAADLLVPPSAIASLTYAVAVKTASRRYLVTIRETGIVTTWFAASWTSMSNAQ